ncbi:HAD-IA family hydrolase [Maricaulis parjimensis]|uniref:HAD-IA family hydrolase n=1 Tax=Maricaulis parjimensis TaxID=144023 RepID=UPI001939D52A|nr:HAD-IA family hydrolase [Maricaulis parjimensis]
MPLDFQAILFDMDGVLVNSNPAIEASWQAWCERNGIDFSAMKPRLHGRKAVEVIRDFKPDADIEAEWQILIDQEMAMVGLTEALPGAKALMSSLPADRWTIVTSAPLELARARLDAAGLPHPEIWVSARDVKRGKPAPDAFLLGAERLQARPQDCLVIEDSRAGIEAALAGGIPCIMVGPESETDPGADLRVRDLSALALSDGPNSALSLSPA